MHFRSYLGLMIFTSPTAVSGTNDFLPLVVTKQKKVKVTKSKVTMPKVIQWDDYNVCVKLAEQWDNTMPYIAERSNFLNQVFELTDKNIYSQFYPEESSNKGR